MSSQRQGLAYECGVNSEHIAGLFGYAMTLTRNQTEAEDLVQETYVRAIRAMARLRSDSNVRAWLFTILRNVWLNEIRHRNSGPKLVDMDGDEKAANMVREPSQDPHALLVSNIERKRVQEAIEQLPGEFREIILLREFEGLSYQEIADILGCPPGTVMSRLSRARSRLRRLLSSHLRLVGTRRTDPRS